MGNILISIIIPLYNGEKYLNKLLKSLLKNKNDQIQIIIVNDGSTDNSKRVLDKYKHDFKIINLSKNHGVSYARNIGLRYSDGEYIAFIDSDDEVSDEYFDVIFRELKKGYDLYAFDMSLVYENEIKSSTTEFKGYVSKRELFNGDFLVPQIISWVTNKFIKREIIVDNKIKFNVNKLVGEDLDFMLKILKHINGIFYINKSLYYYNRMNSKSLTQTSLNSLPHDTYVNNKKIKKFILENNISIDFYEKYRDGIYEYVTNRLESKIKDKNIRNKLLDEHYNLNGKKSKTYIKFSIIIPTYNVEKYISKTLDSILHQTYKKYEIIIIDDGSTDGTREIIKTYKNEKIKIIYEKNSGVSKARNVGLKCATGDYIVFVDGDDYLEDYTLEYLIEEIKNSKKNTTFIAKFNTISEKGCNRNCRCENLDANFINDKSKSEALDYLYSKRIIYAVWRFVAKRELIIKKQLFFKEGIIHEDEEWVPRLLASSKNFKLLEKPFYNYRIRKKSIMTTNRNDLYRENCLIEVAQELLNNAQKSKNEVDKNLFLRNAYKNLFQAYLKIREKANPIEPNVDEKNRLKKNILIYGSSRSGKTTLANILKNNLRYSVISLDNIVSGFERGLPELNINHSNRDGTSVKNLTNYINEYIRSLNGINQKTRMFYYIVEGSYFSKETLEKYKDGLIVIVLINGYKSPKDFYSQIKKHDTISDWTHNLSDEELYNYCELLYKSEQDVKKLCRELKIKYYVTGNSRVETIDNLAKKIEEMVRY